jgi:hypothetical protein
MLKIMTLTILALLLTFAGLYLCYLYISGLDQGTTPLILIPALILLITGTFLLFRAGKSDATVLSQPHTTATIPPANLENTLQKNNALMAEWNKTNDTREKLKLLQAAAQSEDQ